jgi:hypothetical protein
MVIEDADVDAYSLRCLKQHGVLGALGFQAFDVGEAFDLGTFSREVPPQFVNADSPVERVHLVTRLKVNEQAVTHAVTHGLPPS